MTNHQGYRPFYTCQKHRRSPAQHPHPDEWVGTGRWEELGERDYLVFTLKKRHLCHLEWLSRPWVGRGKAVHKAGSLDRKAAIQMWERRLER